MFSQTEYIYLARDYISRPIRISLVFKTPYPAAHMHSCPTLLRPHKLHYKPEEEINFRWETETGFETKFDICI